MDNRIYSDAFESMIDLVHELMRITEKETTKYTLLKILYARLVEFKARIERINEREYKRKQKK